MANKSLDHINERLNALDQIADTALGLSNLSNHDKYMVWHGGGPSMVELALSMRSKFEEIASNLAEIEKYAETIKSIIRDCEGGSDEQ